MKTQNSKTMYLLNNTICNPKLQNKYLNNEKQIEVNTQSKITESIIESIIEPIIFKC